MQKFSEGKTVNNLHLLTVKIKNRANEQQINRLRSMADISYMHLHISSSQSTETSTIIISHITLYQYNRA